MAIERESTKPRKGAPKPRAVGLSVVPPLPKFVDAELPSDWASLVGDLSAGEAPREPEWRIHDRTHLEFAIDYRLDPSATAPQVFEWDAYFFVPESLRLHDQTYEKNEIYDDLQSYVRFAVPSVWFDEIRDQPLERLREAICEGKSDDKTLREMRLFACLVRASGLAAQRWVLSRLENGADEPGATTVAYESAMSLAREAKLITGKLREVLALVPPNKQLLRDAADWVDEDVSRVLETLLATLAIEVRTANGPEALATAMASAAVIEARYRQQRGLDEVGHANASALEIEHLEFRRHVLKRFTSSVLWLSLEVRQAGRLAVHILQAIAAMVAMSFAVGAALYTGATPDATRLWAWALAVVIAYAVKDRIKAALQGIFAKLVSRYFPDRRWRILDRERGGPLGKVHERSGFVSAKDIPEGAMVARRVSRQHPFEEQSRPEHILWHHKSVTIDGRKAAGLDDRFTALTEIFRLNIKRWLDHTDDPKRKIVFADPDDRHVYSAVARRVYNIGIVFRLSREGEESVWHRIRVVVTRKGILRIDRIC